ncbi:hypothetical protein [Metabacillus halosaccharovorans]|uniref:Uncharacterized protein n=1 Tax=Metabacillus halosaccharovorans TaxID=930124 RepID=A0ABT3DGT9_9BACI|nr:hypothetical protein [Metabacillus halosaccharovorans]MCV9886252.1 hypothetical protein [Metabacillus halosaccharovorans]
MIKENQQDSKHHEKKNNKRQATKDPYKMSKREWKEVRGENMQTLRRGKGGAMRRN